jgi:DNA mismatch endonuclease (patch repair protein)
MQATARRDTPAELALRSELHRRGLRYRIDDSPLKGLRRRADIVFRSAKVAVFVDGCYWHGCPEHGTWPKANAEWWRDKIESNKRRDADTDIRLAEAGWHVVRIWAHEDPHKAASRIELVVRAGRTVATGDGAH